MKDWRIWFGVPSALKRRTNGKPVASPFCWMSSWFHQTVALRWCLCYLLLFFCWKEKNAQVRTPLALQPLLFSALLRSALLSSGFNAIRRLLICLTYLVGVQSNALWKWGNPQSCYVWCMDCTFITLSVLTSFCMLCEFAHRTAVLGMSVAPVSRHLLSALCQSVRFLEGSMIDFYTIITL